MWLLKSVEVIEVLVLGMAHELEEGAWGRPGRRLRGAGVSWSSKPEPWEERSLNGLELSSA